MISNCPTKETTTDIVIMKRQDQNHIWKIRLPMQPEIFILGVCAAIKYLTMNFLRFTDS